MTGRPDPSESALHYRVTLSEIADDLVGVSRSRVSNWRVRYRGDFPQPVVDGKRPLFGVDDVLRWIASPSSPVDTSRQPSPRWWWSKAVEAFHTEYAADPTRSFLVALVLLHAALVDGIDGVVTADEERWNALRTEPDPGWPLRDEAARLESNHGDLADLLVAPLAETEVQPGVQTELIERLTNVGERQGSRWAVEEVLLRTADHASRGPEQPDTRAELARLMCLLGGVAPDLTVFDPACGEGSVLVEAGRQAFRRGGVALRGQELDVAAWRIARTRLLIDNQSAELGEPGDSIDDDQWPDLRADVVLVDPPVGPDAPPLHAWVDHALTHLAAGGRAVVTIPAHSVVGVAAARRAPDRKLHARLEALARGGGVEAVVVIPRRVRSDVVGPMTLWILRAEPAEDKQVLVIAHLEDRLRVRRSPTSDLPIATDDITAILDRWRDHAELTPTSERVGVLVRDVPGGDALTTLDLAVNAIGTAPPQSTTSTRPKDARPGQVDDRTRQAELGARIVKLLRLVEPQLEVFWEKDRAAFIEVREEINAIRRLLG